MQQQQSVAWQPKHEAVAREAEREREGFPGQDASEAPERDRSPAAGRAGSAPPAPKGGRPLRHLAPPPGHECYKVANLFSTTASQLTEYVMQKCT